MLGEEGDYSPGQRIAKLITQSLAKFKGRIIRQPVIAKKASYHVVCQTMKEQGLGITLKQASPPGGLPLAPHPYCLGSQC